MSTAKGSMVPKTINYVMRAREFLSYAFMRLDKCPFQEEKPTCAKCLVHCYRPDMKEKAKKIMRYSGSRLIYRSPILALHHLFDGHKKPMTLKEFKAKKAQESTRD
jgi:hypothetical protein